MVNVRLIILIIILLIPVNVFCAEDPGLYWGFWGDSETDGRAPSASSCTSNEEAIRNTRPTSLTAQTNYEASGVGGCSLSESNARYDGNANKADRTWVHFQESGGQDNDGQRTSGDFGTTFEATMTNISTDSPSAIITYETAFSFGREAESYRDWDSYNTQLYTSVSTLAGSGITVVVADVDTNIKALQTALTPADVWYQSGDTYEYHYTPLGNFMVAITTWEALGYVESDFDWSNVSDLDTTGRDIAIDIVFGSSSTSISLEADYETSSATTSFTFAGTSVDGTTVSNVVSNNGTASITSGAGTDTVSGTVSGVSLVSGVNAVQVTLTDSAAGTDIETINITYTPVVPTYTAKVKRCSLKNVTLK